VSAAACRVTRERSGRAVIPKGALLRALLVLRHIRMLLPEGSGTVVEVGSGSGYLTALLGLVGYRVVSTDVTQAFYLWQSALWEHLFGSRFRELAIEPSDLTEFGGRRSVEVVHVPWWKFVVTEPERLRLQVDIISANHTLCEMHPDALVYLLKVGRRWLEVADREFGGFVFEGYGSTLRRSIDDTNQVFAEQGFSPAFCDQSIQVLTLAATSTPFGPTICERIVKGREELDRRKAVGLADVGAYQESLAQGTSVLTDDEKFWRYLHGHSHYG